MISGLNEQLQQELEYTLLNAPRTKEDTDVVFWVGLVSLFNVISTIVGYLIPKLSF